MNPNEKNQRHSTILRAPLIEDDWLRITGQADAHHLARFLERHRPESFAWEDGNGTTRYARSLHAEGGISLSYGRRNADGLNAPQSDTRDSRDFMLEVPGHYARDLLEVLRQHDAARTMQSPRRDLAITAAFALEICPQVYAWFAELLAHELQRPAYRIGPDGSPWNATSLQTHQKPSSSPRFAILYDKHAQDPESYPQPGTLRIEFRFQPEKAAQKRALFWSDPATTLCSWRLSRKALELLTNRAHPKSFPWTEPRQGFDLVTATANLVHSYGPTILRGLHADPVGYLHTLALAALLKADTIPQAEKAHPASLCASELPPTELGYRLIEAKAQRLPLTAKDSTA